MRAHRLLAALACGFASLLANAAPSMLSEAQARHLLVRAGFAASQAEVDVLVGRSAEQAVNDIVTKARASVTRNPVPDFVAGPVPQLPRLLETVEQRQEWRRQQIAEGLQLKTWWMREMIESRTPLAERMTLFWHGHFATSQQKVVRSQAMWRQHELLRANGLGNFRTLLHAIASDPAMLAYLDGANSRKTAPNENFAREVMELFTLGEASQGGGYTEADIREAARAFTGWSIEPADFSFRFRPAFHDAGSKTLFGRSGEFDGDAVIDLLLEQPAAARFITVKLWREFVSPHPKGAQIDAIADRFRSNGYEISALMRDLLLCDTFWADSNRGSLVKSPVELVVGAVRQFGLAPGDTLPMVRKAAQLGQNLLMPPNVKGWPGYTDWIDATRLLERKRFAEQVFRATEPMAAQQQPWAERFLADYGGHPDREPDAAVQGRLAAAMLPVAATQPIASGTVGIAWLRSLMLDAAYQLK